MGKKANRTAGVRRSEKAGLSPGALVHIGKKRTEGIQIHWYQYSPDHFQEHLLTGLPPQTAQTTETHWLDIEGLDSHLLEQAGAQFSLHPLILEDILNTEQRPKLDDLNDYLYIVLKMLEYDSTHQTLQSEQVSLIITSHGVLSFQEGLRGDAFDPIRERLRAGRGRLRRMGSDYLAYALIDSVVDRYFVILEHMGETIEALEEELADQPSPKALQDIHRLKRELLALRKVVWPLREVMARLEKSESSLIHEDTRLFFHDIYDHTIQIIDNVETYREMLSGLLDVYLSSLSYRMNDIMRVLTIIATIFIPLTFIAGVYGMNFKFMPELEWQYGYHFIWGVMLTLAIGMLLYFRRRRWL